MKRVKFAVEDVMNHTAASIYGSAFCPNHLGVVLRGLPTRGRSVTFPV